MNDRLVRSIVILGGGTAGWMSACYLAADARARQRDVTVTIIEAPDIPTVGVGEGTWPTMRQTLAHIGLDEVEFLLSCDASFKQGSRFADWVDGAPGDHYYHPLTKLRPGGIRALLAAWQQTKLTFGEALNAQSKLGSSGIAPRQPNMPGYEAVMNYSYHLDAGKLAALLTRHAVTRLGVRHIADRVVGVESSEDGDITALETTTNGLVDGDLFIDCSGHAALLIAKHFGVGFVDCGKMMLNNRALAAQVPTLPDSQISSMTVATAQKAGWIWDIALPTRRGIGYVHSTEFCDEAEAETTLRSYIARNVPGADAQAQPLRLLKFPTGFREKFWQRNCIAIGLSAGFIEPLEASSIVSIEQSLQTLTQNFPMRFSAMERLADRFNTLFRYRWERIIDFIKLHYVLSRRTEPYWLTQRDPENVPPRLTELLALWRDQPPSHWDVMMQDEIFSFESYQFVYYGMGGQLPPELVLPENANALLDEVRDRAKVFAANLPTNRAYFDTLNAMHGATRAVS